MSHDILSLVLSCYALVLSIAALIMVICRSRD